MHLTYGNLSGEANLSDIFFIKIISPALQSTSKAGTNLNGRAVIGLKLITFPRLGLSLALETNAV